MTDLLDTPVPPFDPFSGQMNEQATKFVLHWRNNVPKLNAIYLAMNEALGSAMLGFTSSSASNVNIALGAASLTIELNKGFVAGQNIKITSNSNTNKYVMGVVTSYNKSNGALVVNVTTISGAGSFNDAQVSINVPDFDFTKMFVESRNTNAMLVKSDSGKLIKCTASFTQTFDSVAALGAGWFCYIKNEGGVEITIPSSDGVTNWKMYDNELRMFYVESGQFKSVIINPFRDKTFTASGTFLKPPGYRKFEGVAWGGGAGGLIYHINGGFYWTTGAIALSSFSINYGTTANYPTTKADILIGATGGDSAKIDVLASALPFANSISIGLGGTGQKYQLDSSNGTVNTLAGVGGVTSALGVQTLDSQAVLNFRKFWFNQSSYGAQPMCVGTVGDSSSQSVTDTGLNYCCSFEFGRASRALAYKNASNQIVAWTDAERLAMVESRYGGQCGQTVGVWAYADTNADNWVDAATFGTFSSPTTKFGGAAGASIIHNTSTAVTAQDGAARGGAGGSIVLNKGLNFVGVLTNFNGAVKAGDGGRGEVILSGVI